MADDIPTPSRAEVLSALLEAIMGFDHWRQIDSGCGGIGPVVMAHRALGIPLPPKVAEWVATSPDSPTPFNDPVGYPWSTNRLVPPWHRSKLLH